MLVSQVYRSYLFFACSYGVGGIGPNLFFPIYCHVLLCFILIDCSLHELSPSRGHGSEEVESNVTGIYSDGLDSKSSHNRNGDLADRV